MSFWTILALLAMGALASFGCYFLKRASAGGFSPARLIRTPELYIGGILYVASSVLNIWLLKVLPYSIILPLGSLSYVWTLIISALLLKEKVRTNQSIGVIIILCGVTMIALSV